MSTIADILTAANTLGKSLADIKIKLDGIATLISQLQAGSISQAQIDSLGAALSSAQDTANAVTAEEDTVNPPAAQP